jgi:hypothetical protein
MKYLVLALALLGTTVSLAASQELIPDLRGTWTGKGKAIVFGNDVHYPGMQTADDPPRVQDITVTHIVEGQQGRVAWGHSSSTLTNTKEPFAWSISGDNRSIVGADMDGYFRITLLIADRMEKCYVRNSTGTGPGRSIVASCYVMNREKVAKR